MTLADALRTAIINGFSIGPAIGAAPGSLVLLTIGITGCDPVFNGLWFERFLSLKPKGPLEILVPLLGAEVDKDENRFPESITACADEVPQSLRKMDLEGKVELLLWKYPPMAMGKITLDQAALHQGPFGIRPPKCLDKLMLERIWREDTLGAMSMYCPEMHRIFTRVKPKNFYEIAALLALNRPGPAEEGFLEDYIIAQESGIPHQSLPCIMPFLEETYGVPVYYEQWMDMAVRIAKFTPEEANSSRKAIGMRSCDVLKQTKEKLRQGAMKNEIASIDAMQFAEYLIQISSHLFFKTAALAEVNLVYQMLSS